MTAARLAAALALAALAALARSESSDASAAPALRVDMEMGAAQSMSLEAGQNRLLVLSEQIGRVAVANPEVADLKVVTPTQVLLTAKRVGTTDLTLWNRDNRPLVIAVAVSRSLEPLRKQLKELFPGEAVSVSSAGELVVLSGEVSDLRLPERIAEVARLHAEKVANLVRVSGVQQVQLQVRFAEVSRSGLRELGVNLFHKSTDFREVGGMFSNRTVAGEFLNTTTNPAIPGTGGRGLAGPGYPPDVPVQPFPNAFSIFFSAMGSFPLSAIVSLLEENNLAKVLAEPTLVTMSGQQAKFLAGGELPIPLANGLGTTTVEWKKFGIQLEFTPTVIGDAVHLALKTEVSDLDPTTAIVIAGTTIPGLATRQSQTTVRLGDGQSFAIAGLLSDRIRSSIGKVPLLGSIPILGALFRSTSYQRDESELLVIVTAHLVKPVAPHELPPLPTEYEDNSPGDLALFLLGSEGSATHAEASRTRAAPDRGPSGPHGFSR